MVLADEVTVLIEVTVVVTTEVVRNVVVDVSVVRNVVVTVVAFDVALVGANTAA